MIEPRRILPAILLVSYCLGACAGEPETAETAAAAAIELLEPPSGPGAMAPRLAAGSGDTLLTWLEPVDPESGGGFRLVWATLETQVWSAPRELARGDAFFANWADLPAMVEAAGDLRFAHWLEKLGDDTYAYGVQLARSTDGGETWQRLGLLHDDASPAEHGFVSYVPLAEGVQAFWLDGRAMAGGAHEDEPAEHAGGSMQLRTTRLGAQGQPPVSTVLDERVCECCQTAAALTADGPIVVYRDRDATEIRDVAVVRATAEGWSEPATLHADRWQIHGCPVNGPAVAAAGDRVAVAWFTAAGENPRVMVAFSGDSGASFGAPIEVDAEQPSGRVDVVLVGGDAYVSWMGTQDGAGEIRLRRVSPTGELGRVRHVATTSAKRSAGVPRMVVHGDGLLLTWVEDAKPSRLRVGLLPLG